MTTTAPYADNGNTLMSTFRVATGQRVSLDKATQTTLVDTYVERADLGLTYGPRRDDAIAHGLINNHPESLVALLQAR
ncbi:hypothetical protein PBI_GRAYSON_8 [Rhodococcus phage Grayson]|nr:hypothetical protein PBI_GRAYSON_8 [Rhodococcus phage Grayson]